MNKNLLKLRDKVLNEQNGIMTFADVMHRDLLSKEINGLTEEEKKVVNVFESLEETSRFVSFKERKENKLEWPIENRLKNAYSQGVFKCMSWKGMPLFKTPADMALLNMLIWEIKPGCIVEIGSGAGTSAEYLSDITKVFNLNTAIVSFDNTQVLKNVERVTFLYGDCNDPTTFEGICSFISNDRPTIFLEDAHQNVEEVLKYLLCFAKPGDYFLIEDSGAKQKALSNILGAPGLLLDTKLLDFFGKNSTCCFDSIFKVTVDFLGRPLYNEYMLTQKGD